MEDSKFKLVDIKGKKNLEKMVEKAIK
jgi:hypothetical protein